MTSAVCNILIQLPMPSTLSSPFTWSLTLQRIAFIMQYTYISSDWIEDGGHEVTDHPIATPEFLSSLNESGIPPHELVLKVGAICRLTRNFDASRGLAKNTRVIVRRLFRHTVEVETMPRNVGGTACRFGELWIVVPCVMDKPS